jgi:hypothetical protein
VLALVSVSGAGAVGRRILAGMVLNARARVGLGVCMRGTEGGTSAIMRHIVCCFIPPCILLALHSLRVALCLSQVVGVRVWREVQVQEWEGARRRGKGVGRALDGGHDGALVIGWCWRVGSI